MSLISKALKKIQDARLGNNKEKVGDIVYLTDAPKSLPKTAFMFFLFFGTIVAVLFSTTAIFLSMRNTQSRQIQVISLEKTIKAQEKRINDLINVINKNQKFKDNQIRDLNYRFNSLNSTGNAHYDSVKEAIVDEKQQIDSLEQYVKSLESKIATTNPASGT